MKIVHCISGLNVGGAEIALARVALAGRNADPLVVSITPPGPIGDRLEAAGVRVATLGKVPGRPDPRAVFRLARLLRQEHPQVLQTWMYEANLYGLAAGKLASVPRIVWNLRCADMDWRHYPRGAAAAFRLNAALSRVPDAIVANSWFGLAYHRREGFHDRRMRVIPNGFDLAELLPDPATRRRVRQRLGIDAQVPVVGMVARLDPAKDHAGFARAAARVAASTPAVRFVLAGSGITADNETLLRTLGADVRWRCHLLGAIDDVPALMSALDLLVLSSAFGEAFPNVLGEAMSCRVPCISTDVGDAARIIGTTGRVVPRGDPQALAAAIEDLLGLPAAARAAMGAAARERIQRSFSIAAATRRYDSLYAELAHSGEAIPCPA